MTAGRPHSQSPTAFSLIELLVVLAIVAIAMALTVPALRSLTGGLDLTRAADLTASQLALARQTALSRNRTVEVRFYSYARDATSPRIVGLQAFVATEDEAEAWEPLSRVQKLPTGVCIDAGPTLSPLLAQQTSLPGSQTGVALPDCGMNYTYTTVAFRPDGSATSPSGADFITLIPSRLEEPLTQLPDNYAILQINPLTGRLRTYRP